MIVGEDKARRRHEDHTTHSKNAINYGDIDPIGPPPFLKRYTVGTTISGFKKVCIVTDRFKTILVHSATRSES